MTRSELAEKLIQEGLLEGPPAWPADGETPWYVRVMLGMGAWVASLLVLLWMGAFGFFENEATRWVWGALSVGVARALWTRNGEFLHHLSRALFISGALILIFFQVDRFEPSVSTLAYQWGTAFVLVMIYPDLLSRIVLGLVAGAVGGYHAGAPEAFTLVLALLSGAVWWRRPQWLGTRYAGLCEALGYTCVLNLYGFLWYLYSGSQDTWEAAPITVVLALLVTWAVARIQAALELGPGPGLLALLATVLVGALTLTSPGAIAGYGLLLVGFHVRSTPLQALAWAFLLSFAALHYYSLEFTLLAKGVSLLGTGALFLGMRRQIP